MRHARSILAFAALLCLPLLADEAPTAVPAATPTAPAKEKGAKNADPKAAPATANLVVVKDSGTGELRPATAAEREQLLGRRPLVAATPEIVTLPNGTVMVKERPEDANFTVATRKADGTLSYTCVHGADSARAATATPTPAPKSADR